LNLNNERRKKMKKVLLVLLGVIAVLGFMGIPAISEDKLVVMDSTGTNPVFSVQDGSSVPNRILVVSGGMPVMQNAGTAGFDFRNTGATYGASISVGTAGNPNLYANWLGVTTAKDDLTKVSWGLRLDITHDNFHVLRSPVGGGFSDVFVINANGSISSSTGASLSSAGKWLDSSSRDYKDDVEALAVEDAFDALKGLNPVRFTYKADRSERHVGFIAEEVPELVATKDRRGLSSMDIVAVLTKVVQEQQATVQKQQAVINTLVEKLTQLETKMEGVQTGGIPISVLSQK
jgi:hypothetical protein